MPVIPYVCCADNRNDILKTHGCRTVMMVLILLLSMARIGSAAIIAIDPGHGGDDNGASNGNAMVEKQFTLALAQRTAVLLAADHRVELTRNTDATVPVTDRAGMVNQLQADLMISLHAAVSPYCSERKAAVYYYDDQRLVFPPGISNHAPDDDTETDHPQWETLQIRHHHRSMQLATLIKQFLLDGGALDEVSVSGAPLAVIMGVDHPAVLIEIGCRRPSTAVSASDMDKEIETYSRSIAKAVNQAVAIMHP